MSKPEQLDNAVFRRERYYPAGWKSFNSQYVCNFCGVRAMHMKALSKHRHKYHDQLPDFFPTLEMPLREQEAKALERWREKRKNRNE